jgi:ABC-type glutathione transport system ATPase component
MNTVLRIVELPDRLIDLPASRLTGAQRFSMWLAIARLRQTPILLLDDPTPAWTIAEVTNMIPLIRDFRALGVTTLLATRDTGLASALADRVCVMEEGRKVIEGPTDIVFGGVATGSTRAMGIR